MATRSEKERQKAQQEKFQAILSNLLKDDDNKYCVDCDAKGPRWASWNLGVFLCIRCAGIHRNLGVHISKVKSVNLDTWTPEQVAMMMEVGNSRARAAYEANLPDSYRRPQTDSALESFVRAKYEHKKYLAKEWVTPKPVVPKELLEDDKDKRKGKQKTSSGVNLSSIPRSQNSSSSSLNSANSSTSKPTNQKPAPPTQATPPQQPAPPPNNNSADLIGLVFAQSAPLDSPDAPSVAPTVSTSNNLLDDFMGGGGSGVTTATSSVAAPQQNNTQVSNGLEADLFGDSSSGGSEAKPKASTKDSIMALFGGQQQSQPQQPTQFGVPAYNEACSSSFDHMVGVMPPAYFNMNCEPQMMYTYTESGYGVRAMAMPRQMMGGVYMPQQQQSGAMYSMQQQQQQQQQQAQMGMYGNQQMGMMAGMQQQQRPAMMQAAPGGSGMMVGGAMMGAPQQGMGVQMGAQQQGNAGMMYGQQNMQQMQFNQMHQQMGGMNLGQPQGGAMNMAGMGWGGAQNSGHTLSTNLWQ